jgi:hypothetical protein
LEDRADPIAMTDRQITIPLHPYEIVTLRLHQSPSQTPNLP